MLKFLGFSVVLFFLTVPAFTQNTKGDRPVKNQRQVRETKVKSVRRKEKGTTRDLAGRRLRTKDRSSANRANAKYPKPSPYSNRVKKQPEKAASPRGRVFSKSPRESRPRAWKGDVSGYHLKRVKPTGADAARTNVYPQKGPYVRYARKRPKEKPPIYSRTIKGTQFVKHRPRAEERAWRGGLDKGPIKNQSATGSIRNVYPQTGPYVAYYHKRLERKEKPVSNRRELSQVRRLSRKPRTGGSEGSIYPASVSRSYVQRGRKNVYWGKVQKKERAVTSDITGGPLRTRNYKSSPAGLVGRDTLKFFGRKPFGDRSKRAAGGYATATKRGQRGWKGDVTGWPIRRPGAKKAGIQKPLTPTEPGIGALWISKIFDKRFKGVKPSMRIPDTRAARFQGNVLSTGAAKTFGDQGTGYSGNIRRQGATKTFNVQGIGYSGNMKGTRGFTREGAGYSGNIKRSQVPGFSREGANYSGNIKGTRSFSRAGVDYSGNIKGKRGFSRAGAGYSGNINRNDVRGFSSAIAGYSGNVRRSILSEFSAQGANYSGNLKRKQGFGRQGADYSGTLRRVRPEKGGGSVSGILWNNRNQSVTRSAITLVGIQALRYSGDTKRVGPVKTFGENGVGYSGFLRGNQVPVYRDDGAEFSGKIKRSSISGFDRQGAGFSGRTKFKRPEKGGGSVSGILWNNENHALVGRAPLVAGANAVSYSGKTKLKRPEKGGGSVSGILWNNENRAIVGKTPLVSTANAVSYSGKIGLARFKKNRIQNPNAFKESIKKKRPDESTYRVAGLQIKVRQGDYKKKTNANKYSLPGLVPKKSSVKASEYVRNMKQNWSYRHNPNSATLALKGIAPNKAMARVKDYQGNVKMHKYSGSRLHPDAQFAHGYDDNVKEERTFLTNVKLLWSRLFRKNETQPENLKEKIRKPQYDKREKGLWND